MTEQKYIDHDNIVHMARLGLEGDLPSLQSLVRRLQRQLVKSEPELAAQLSDIISQSGKMNKLRRAKPRAPSPSDADTKQQLLRIEQPATNLPQPDLPEDILKSVKQIVLERQKMSQLRKLKMEPTKSAVFFGPPGVGKTMTARWIAKELKSPLYILDLSSVMSSLLGKTGANLKAALEFAKEEKAILLLDEFDAIAKSRTDETDIGELKRLVTVLLQEVDLWPSDSLIIAATNHPELIDRAIWRRFDASISFPLPQHETLITFLKNALGTSIGENWIDAFARIAAGKSIADVEVLLGRARRRAIVFEESLENSLAEVLTELRSVTPKSELKAIARAMREAGISQREISNLTGLARDTIRKID